MKYKIIIFSETPGFKIKLLLIKNTFALKSFEQLIQRLTLLTHQHLFFRNTPHNCSSCETVIVVHRILLHCPTYSRHS